MGTPQVGVASLVVFSYWSLNMTMSKRFIYPPTTYHVKNLNF